MSWGILGRIFKKKRAKSQDSNNSKNKSQDGGIHSSAPNLAGNYSASNPNYQPSSSNFNRPPVAQDNLQSFGEINPQAVDSDDEYRTNTGFTTYSKVVLPKIQENTSRDNKSTAEPSTSYLRGGYESSSESSTNFSKTNDYTTVTVTRPANQNDDLNDITSVYSKDDDYDDPTTMSNVKRNATYSKGPGGPSQGSGQKGSTLDKIMAQRKNNDSTSVGSQKSGVGVAKRVGSPANPKQTPSSVIQVKPSPKTVQKQDHSMSPRQPSTTNDTYQDSGQPSPRLDKQKESRERYEQFVKQMAATPAKPVVPSPASPEVIRNEYQAPPKQVVASTPQEVRKPKEYVQPPMSQPSPVSQHHQDPPKRHSPKAHHDEKRVSIHDLATNMDDLEKNYKKKIGEDMLIAQVHDFMTRNTSDPNEKNRITQLLLSNQQQRNEVIINKQKATIDQLKTKCEQLEHENDKLTSLIKSANNQDINELKNLIYPLSKQVNEFITEQTLERKKRADDNASLGRSLYSQSETNFNPPPAVSQAAAKREEDIRELIHRAELVVGENQFLKSQLEMKQSIIENLKKNELLKINSASERSIQMEAQHINLTNEIEQLKMINTELQTKYRDCAFKLSKSIVMEEHEKQIAEIRSRFEEQNMNNMSKIDRINRQLEETRRNEESMERKLESFLEQYKNLLREKEDLTHKLNDAKFKIEQDRKQILSLELSHNESKILIRRLKKEYEQAKLLGVRISNDTEHPGFNKAVLSSQDDRESKVLELEEKIENLKDKFSLKISKLMLVVKEKENRNRELETDYENRINQLVSNLQSKQAIIDNFLKEKKNLELELDGLVNFSASSFDSKRLKETLIDMKNNV